MSLKTKIDIWNRFLTRMYLPPGYKCLITSMQLAVRKEDYDNNDYWQTYHVCRDRKSADAILKHGFRVGPACNKGYGVYTAAHGRYALNWAPECPVIVCLVKKVSTKVFHSEIYAPQHSFELVTRKSEDVIPLAKIEYKLEINQEKKTQYIFGFQTSIGPVGCKECDVLVFEGTWKRCDCELQSDLKKGML